MKTAATRDDLATAVAGYLGCGPAQLTDGFEFEEYGADVGDVREVVAIANRTMGVDLSESAAGSIATFGDLWREVQAAD